MAFTLQQYQAITTAIASGTLEVQYADKRVKYHSLKELMDLRNLIRSELEGAGVLVPATGTNRGPSSLAVFSRD
jgi:hypothetical protein